MNDAPGLTRVVGGPLFEDLHPGLRFTEAPAVTLTGGLAATHQAIVGGRLRVVLDHGLGRRVAGDGPPLAPPGLAWDVAIGQSSVVTQNVVANLFYRGVALHRAPRIGDTLSTTTEIAGLRQNSRRPGRPATGLAVLRITTVDQQERPVLDFWRCAMLPLRDQAAETGWADDPATIGRPASGAELRAATGGWDVAAYRGAVPGPHFADLTEGTRAEVVSGDVVSSAPELARLTTNLARVHHDESVTGRRLVFGGHTIGLALAQAVRAFPGMVTVVGWHSCDHVGPVHEGDTVWSTVEVDGLEPLARGGLAHLRSRVRTAEREVLDWRFVALFA
jgi:acyl dehydratase